MLLHRINSQGKDFVETATLLFSPVHIVLERSLLVVNEGPEEVACVLIANGRPEATPLGLMRHNAIDVEEMASRA